MDALSKNQSLQEDRSSRNSGSISGDRIKMLDITRDKPIKVAVKVAVPVRDHPKFNFVGKLLGPKGNSMKRLQEDTMCKMAVLGRGSMKDRKKEEELRLSGEPRYAHLSEDLHVEISTFAAPAEAHARIAYALAEVRRFLVPDYHDDIRQEQMWEMQALSSSSSSSSQTQTGEQNSPNSLAGATIIGCNGNSNGAGTNIVVSESISINTDVTESTPTSGTLPTASATTTSTTLNSHTIHPTVAAAIQHQLATTGMGIIKPATGVAAVTGLTPTNQTTLGMPSEAETTTPTLALLEPPGALLHPALRGVKTVNIASGLARKRPLLGVPRSGMNPTKRTVMTLLARAKNSQTVHAAIRNSTTTISTPSSTAAAAAAAATAATNGHHIPEYFLRHHAIRIYPRPLHMITSPLIPPQTTMDESMIVQQKENLSQGI